MYTQCTLYTAMFTLLSGIVSELHIEDAFAGGQTDSGLRPKQQKKIYFSIKTGTFIVGKEYNRMTESQNCTTQ